MKLKGAQLLRDIDAATARNWRCCAKTKVFSVFEYRRFLKIAQIHQSMTLSGRTQIWFEMAVFDIFN